MSKYVDSKVWLRSSGCVVGWDPDRLNEYIDRYNRLTLHKYGVDFWTWLSYETGEYYTGFSVLWASKLDSKIHIIKGGS